jgi:hypothetical protein
VYRQRLRVRGLFGTGLYGVGYQIEEIVFGGLYVFLGGGVKDGD